MVLSFHAATSAAGRKNESIGKPVTSLSRLASSREADFRPALMLRKCGIEQPTRAAKAAAARSSGRNGAKGCSVISALNISDRNSKVNGQIFPEEMSFWANDLIEWGMGKKAELVTPAIHLGNWLEFFEVGATDAAKIAGCSQPYISNIIAGRKTNINSLYLFRLSEHLGVNINDFYRPLPTRSQLSGFNDLSGRARTAILLKQRRDR
jgi:hypothetical protein